MVKWILGGLFALGLAGGAAFAQLNATHRASSADCLPKGAVCKWSSDCCSGSCAGPSPPVCQ